MIPIVLMFFFGQPQVETADSIMARVAANQDRAEEARAAFVYRQNVLVRMNRTNGKLASEQYSEYTVTPTASGIKKERTQFTGKYIAHGKTVEYHDPKQEHGGLMIALETGICTDLGQDLSGDKQAKDGIAHDLFPLTAKEQKHYVFRTDGTEDYRGTPVYRIVFEPKKGQEYDYWAGEALVDQKEYQPLLVTTHQAFKVPLVVKTVLGTNIEHLGFKLTYKKFDEGLWFPVSYGGEFKVRALFFYGRRVGISVQNTGFQRADVSSKVNFAAVE